MSSPNQRRFGGVVLVCALAGSPLLTTSAAGAPGPASPDSTIVEVTVTEGTNLAVTTSPADGTMVMDLQGQLFSLPRAGGKATAIGADNLDPYWPTFAPDGSQVAVQSYAYGSFDIVAISPDGKTTRQITKGDADDTYPTWSPDSKQLAFTSDRAGGEDIWVVDAAGGEPRQVTKGAGSEEQPTWAPDGKSIAYVQGATVESVDLATGAVRTLVPGGQGFTSAPSWSPDGKRLAFLRSGQAGRTLSVLEDGIVRQVGKYTDVFPFPPRWTSPDEVVYGANGKIAATTVSTGVDRAIPFTATFTLRRDNYLRKEHDFDSRRPQQVRGIVGPALSPDGKSVVFKALNDLWLQPVAGGAPKRLTDDQFYEVDPSWSRDGKQISYTSDKAGSPDVYALDVASGQSRQLTKAPGGEVASAWSPDGRTIAYQDQNAQTFTLDVATGAATRVLGPLNVPGRPSWSADGKTLAFTSSVAERNQILLLDVASGTTRTVEPGPFGSVSTRGDDGPVWSPDGRWLAYSMNGVLWVLPVDAKGAPTGPPQQLTTEASDAPSWSGDSKTLLYLNNGRLRTITLDGGKPRDIAVRLTYAQDKPETKLVIHAGRLWDGVREEPYTNVDILVVGNRIQRIEPHKDNRPRPGWTFIDASKQTVTPGLVDMHNHQEMKSKFMGDRQGRLLLSYGITTTRSTGDPAYRALEDKESLKAGNRIGPRFFATGEMLEGSRVGWEFARPVRDEQQLAVEQTRIRELDYDLIKTYQRFRVDWQAKAAAYGHKLGIPTTSHYLYPAIGHAVDMKEHLAGPTKWGFGFARESSFGGTYDDVVQLAARGRMPFSSTLFSAGSTLVDDQQIMSDPRVRALMTPQDQAFLNQKLKCALGQGPCGFLDGNAAQARRDVGLIRRLIDAGGTVLAGTDAPLDIIAVSLHLNLRAMAKYGLTPYEALRSATILPAQQLGVEDDLGSVTPGKLADLVITGGDPTKDIAALADVRSVIKNGRPYTVAELAKPFAG
ncbi:amidohydrolase family protein [Actinokineospora auranticolor]|uniref:Tol biopolymer transport system component n=1 Tax=Actinokineospora auranticolor TaxID=155976 RepID=A0A2S6GC50_9PSEU|nr:amidohydrolase family protein [Actinokineospora auranticolor]PPK62063.1 Tol biopolymer transport system component [Actinokineospora auranticolor]